MSKCSALVLPNRFEGFWLVLLEAFAMNKPVLVADVKLHDKIVDEGIHGFIFSAHDLVRSSEKNNPAAIR